MKPDKGNNNGNNNKRNIMGLVSIIFWALLFTMMIKSCTSSYANMGTVEVPYTTFKEWLAEDKIDTVNVENGKYTFTLRDGVEVELPREETSGGSGSLMNSLIPVPAQTEEEKQYITVPLAGVDDPELLAMQTDTCIISTAYDAYRAVRLIYHAMPISSICKNKDLVCFHLDDYIDDVQNTVLESRFRAYPILDEEERVVGTLSRYHLLRPRRKQVILMDHNEKAQSVPGLDQAEILEIIDHHRLADIQTKNPITVRNEPVGSTTTIVAGMYQDKGLMPTAKMAGLMAAAIVSDTVMFKSPTCTQRDIDVANRMARIANISLQALGQVIFSASGGGAKSAEEIFRTDYKEFHIAGHNLAVSQVTCMDSDQLLQRKGEFLQLMSSLQKKQGFDMVILMITDVLLEGTQLLFVGDRDSIRQAFNVEDAEDVVFLPKVMSRKKQVIPMLSALWG